MSAKVPPPPLVIQRLGYCAVPAAIDVGVGGVGVVVGIDARAVGGVGAVTAEEAHVDHERVGAGLPQSADRAIVDAVGVEAEAGDDVHGRPVDVSSSGTGAPGPWKAAVPSSMSNCVMLGWRPMRTEFGLRCSVLLTT